MPVPKPTKGEKQNDYMARCMHEVSKNPDRSNTQNVAICMNTWREAHKSGASKLSLTCFAAKIGKIDAKAGVIYGVSVITVGEVQGHGMYADAETLRTVKATAETYEGGLKVKLDHGSSVGAIVGYLDSFRIDGKQLRADLHLLTNSEHYDYVIELASTMPDQVGMSIAFAYDLAKGDDEEETELDRVRCVEIFSCDLVDSPAANVGGLFSSNSKMSDKTETPVTPAAAEPTIESRLAALEAAFASLNAKFADSSALSTQLSAIETVVNGFAKQVETQKEEFARALTEQATEFTSQLKDANILASRKLAATGIPHGKAPAAEAGNIVDFSAAMLSLKDPREQLEFYNKHKEKIHAQFGRK